MSIQTEQQVIYSLLVGQDHIQDCDLEPHEFQHWQNQEVYRAICSLTDQNQIPDILSVAEKLEAECPEYEFLPYLYELTEKGFKSGAIEQHAAIIRKHHRKSQALAIADRLKQGLQSGGNENAVDSAIQELMSLNTVGKNYDHSMKEVMYAATKMVSDAAEMDGIKGIDTGLQDLNDTLGGFNKTDLIVIGARPAMGKTAFMLNLALAAKEPVGIISAEQGYEQIGLRLVSVEGKVDSQKLRTGGFWNDEWDDFGRAVNRLSVKPIRVNDEPAITISKVIRQARDWKYKYGIKALYVDYLQKIEHSDKSQPRHIQVGEIARSLKNLGRELDIPIIALAQVNRQCEQRPDKRPHNSDLADAGEIEKEADVIMFLYRDEVYYEDTDDKGIAELIAAKNRHGPTGTIRCVFVGKFMRFEQIAPQKYAEMMNG